MPMLSVEMMVMLGRAAALTFALLLCAWALHRWRRSTARDTQRLFEQLDLIRGELLLLSDRLDQRESVPRVSEAPKQPEIRSVASLHSPAPRGYEVAARLARGGATCDELISSCGVSRHEAQLLLRLHGAEAARTARPGNTSVSQAAEERRTRLSVVG